jgi:hypothetical protein
VTQKFYLHDATTGDSGTLPASTATISASTPAQTPALTNKSMDATIGTLQKSTAITTLANTSAQNQPIARFLSSPIAAQTIAQQDIAVHWAGNTSNTNSNFSGSWSLAVWRPGSGSLVGRLTDVNQSSDPSFNFTAETAGNSKTLSASTTSQTSQDGDVLVLELWRDTASQGMSTAYTNTVFYDGTTEDSTSTNAAYLLFINDVALFTAAAQVPYVNRMPPLIAQ